MKLSELYSVMSLIFAANFNSAIDENKFEQIQENWLVKNETDENKKGHKYLAKAKQMPYKDLCMDFDLLKPKFELDYYKLISNIEIELFFEKARFVKPFSSLKSCHVSNMLSFLAAVFKQDKDEKTHILLGKYLTEYLISSLRALASDLQVSAKSDYYRAMGWFLQDYCNMVKISIGLKA